MSMSRRKKPGAESQPFSVRWHSFADITTPSVDIMSSPDPLNDSATEAVIMPSSANRATRSVTRSLRSDRFLSRDASPRKQTFELEVGDNKAPQRLLVTVETEGAAAAESQDGIRRKLFQSSSPMPTIRQRERATTTVVPLKETIEEENFDLNATPRKRGRPRKSNGTPIPSAGRKRRAGTPIKRTPRRPRKSKSAEEDEGPDEAKPEPTPKSARRGRPPKNRNPEPSSEPGFENARGITSETTGRKRRQALAPEDSMNMSELPDLARTTDVESQEDNEVTLITLPPSEPADAEASAPPLAEPGSEPDSDIWMATLDDEPTPRASRTTQSARGPPSPEPGNSSRVGDFGYLAPAASDPSSFDEPVSEHGRDNDDTIAQGEDFSMIFMDSLPALRSSVHVPVEADYGDETSLIINNTLESLRESLRKSVQQHNESNSQTEAASSHEFSFLPIPTESEPVAPQSARLNPLEPEYISSDHSESEESELIQPELTQHEFEPVQQEDLLDVEPVEPELTRRQHQELSHLDADHGESDQAEPEHLEPEHVELEDAEAERIEPDQNEADLIELDDRESGGIEEEPEVVEREYTEREDVEQEPVEPTEKEAERSSPDIGKARPTEPETAEPDDSDPEELQQPTVRPLFPFSPSRNLSPRWLRSPRRGNASPLRHQLLKFKARQTDDTPPRAAAEVPNEPAASSPGNQGNASRFNEGESRMYEDSFSEIPNEVLDAATPHRNRTATINREVEEESTVLGIAVDAEPAEEDQVEDTEMRDIEPAQEDDHDYLATLDSNTSHLSQPEGVRLPTPDDTPPQIDDEVDDQAKSTQESQHSSAAPSPRRSSPIVALDTQSQSVPEIVEDLVEEEEVEEEEGPEESGASGSQPPESSPSSHTAKPKVTPLNQMTSPAQEPQSLAPEAAPDKVARPFLSPIVRAGRALQSVTSDPPSPEPREHQLRSPFRSSITRELGPPGPTTDAQVARRMSSSPRRPLSFSAVAQAPNVSQVYDDPFGSATRHTGQSRFMKALERSSGRPASPRDHESLTESPASSMRNVPPDDVQMSWIADEGPISASLRGDVPLKDLAPSEASHEAGESMPFTATESRERPDRFNEAPQEEEEEADEMDIWEFEAERAAPRTTRQQPFGNRRRGLPSPWTKQSRESPQREVPTVSQAEDDPEDAQESVSDADRTEDAEPEESQAEELSLLTQRDMTKEAQAPESANKASRFDLSSFFSSPAAIPGMLADKFLPANARSVFGSRPSEPEPEPVQAAPVLPTSSMFPQIAPRNFQPGSSSQPDLSSPDRARTQETRQETPSSPQKSGDETEEELEMPSVPQKQNFTPRPKQPNMAFFRTSTRSSAPTPPRMQLSHADIERWQHETSVASEASPEVHKPLLRPLPPKNASPIKSSLRSPLKPHTPGRVVEFTSSVLSPVEQAKARQSRRLSNSSAASQSQPIFVQQRPPPQTADKENNRSLDVQMSDASPSAKSTQPESLSRTVWTRQHWLLMDAILQMRRAGPFEISYERRADQHLGKTVRSLGEAVTLERWHLDCVDAFKAEVGGWDEVSLLKRLASLILGEQKRSRGAVDRPARVMFH